MSDSIADTRRANLARLLSPKTIGLVGLKSDSMQLHYIDSTINRSDARIYWINPRVDEVLGNRTYGSLAEVPEPLDAVFIANNPKVSVQYAEEAADLGNVGGLILISGGFAEAGGEGVELQQRLAAAAARGGFVVAGPNGLGVVNARRNINLSLESDYVDRRPGGISLVSQSGALLHGLVIATNQRPPLGVNVAISAGNEAVTDLADYVDFFAEDPDTSAIGLVIEKIRRPKEFFAAARKAMLAGKPIVALKLARSARTQELAASHTGSLTGDAWVYEVAFKQLGIGLARDPEELIDRLSIVTQLDEKYWTKAENLAILTFTGGFASLTTDVASDEGVDVPPLDEFRPWIQELLPGVVVPNPLDTASMGGPVWDQILEKYGTSPDVDVAINVHPVSQEDYTPTGTSITSMFAEASEKYGKPFIIANCSGDVGQWVHDIVDPIPGAAVGYAPRGALRGIQTLGHFVRSREKLRGESRQVAPIAKPTGTTIAQPEGTMLNFADSMELLAANGIPIAPYHLIPGDAEVTRPPFAGPYVVKLADVGHRTEHGAVLLKIAAHGLAEAVAKLRGVAETDGLPPLVAVQPMAEARGEAFIGIQNSELGPMVVFGLGGIFVEVLRKVGGRLAPFDRSEAEALVEEFRDAKLLHGFRGQPAWNLEKLADLLVAAGDFAAASAGWLDSLDVNPLLVVGDEFMAVDALVLVRD